MRSTTSLAFASCDDGGKGNHRVEAFRTPKVVQIEVVRGDDSSEISQQSHRLRRRAVWANNQLISVKDSGEFSDQPMVIEIGLPIEGAF